MLSSSISADPTKPVSTQFEEDQTPTDAQETTDAPETTDKEEKETVDIKEVDDEVEDKDGKETVDIKEEDAEGEDKDVEMPTLKVNENDATFKKEPTPNSKLPPFPKQGWESPTQEPVQGQVHPRTVPPPGKPTKQTNQLEYLAKEILKPALKHKHAWPFLKPVDAIKLNIPDYHKVIKKPMDLGTIDKRLKNHYYMSADECINDLMTMFTNCFTYCPAHFGVYNMAKMLETDVLAKLEKMPATDFRLIFNNCYQYNQVEDDVTLMCNNIEKLLKEKLITMPKEEIEVPKAAPKKAGKSFSSSKKAPSSTQRGASISSVGRGSVVSSPHSAAPSESAAAVLDYFHNATLQVSRESSAVREPEEKKIVKRKAETPPVPVVEEKVRRADHSASRYEALKNMDYSTLKPRYTGKLSSQMKFCNKLIQEMNNGKKCKDFAWPFLEPVNDIMYQIFDYYTIIKKPMDLGTVKKKLDARQYATPQEFKDDVNQIVTNCCTYNAKGTQVHECAVQLQKYLDARWKDLPKEADPIDETPIPKARQHDPFAFPGTPASSAPLVQSTPLPPLSTGYGALNNDDDIDGLLAEVQNEHLRMTQRMNNFQQFIQELLQLKLKRREARQQRGMEPSLSGELHSHIKRSLISATPAPSAPFTPVASSLSMLTPINHANALGHGILSPTGQAAASAATSSAAAAYSNGVNNNKRGRPPKGGARLVEIPQLNSFAAPTTPLQSVQNQFSSSSNSDNSGMPPPAQAPATTKSGRGRKPGSKNKPKNQKKDDRMEYEFNSDEEREPMTYEEKKRLSAAINNLPGDRLSSVLGIINKRENFRDDVNPEEVEIDFETLQPKTLRELDAFVQSCTQKTTKKSGVQRNQEPEARKKQIEERLAQMNNGQPTRRGAQASTSGGPGQRGRPPAGGKGAMERDASSSSSSSSSDSSEGSSSSDSSDSESEEKDNVQNGAPSSQQNGQYADRQANPPNKATNNNTLNSAPGINGAKPPVEKRNIVHSGAGPLLQNNNAAIHAGISGSVLDHLLPAAEANPDSNAAPFDQMRNLKRQHDSMLAEQRRDNVSNAQDDIYRLKQAEKERRQRETATDDGITNQMDIMANFEDNF